LKLLIKYAIVQILKKFLSYKSITLSFGKDGLLLLLLSNICFEIELLPFLIEVVRMLQTATEDIFGQKVISDAELVTQEKAGEAFLYRIAFVK
jgi:hypothetical protein